MYEQIARMKKEQLRILQEQELKRIEEEQQRILNENQRKEQERIIKEQEDRLRIEHERNQNEVEDVQRKLLQDQPPKDLENEFKPQFNQVRKQPKKLQRHISPPKVASKTVSIPQRNAQSVRLASAVVVPQTVNNKPYQPIQPQRPKINMNIQPKQPTQIRNPQITMNNQPILPTQLQKQQIAVNNPPIQPVAANQDNQEPIRETPIVRGQGGFVMPLDILSQVKLKKAGQQPPVPGPLKATPNTQQVKAKDDSRFKAYFDKLNQKMPKGLIAMQMRNNGLDPEVLNRPDDIIPPY
ncbi:MAG: hypothetical protein EZS28_027505 [Streblomastix strix]|uniref:Uncharacterized protein n=1 Tax=Streblomastix strix TaxID=222440 RepID=A0A5J4V3N4_9EUKA|nr:MAG: hypothetical protein EZS28_027505 [Streblomastix strix]